MLAAIHAHLSVHWPIVVTLMPLSCVAMTSLGLLLGTTFEPRNIGLMFGFVVLPLTFLGGTYYQWTELAPVTVGGVHWLQIVVLINPLDLRRRGHAGRPDPRVAHAPVRHLPGAGGVHGDIPHRRSAQLPAAGARLEPVSRAAGRVHLARITPRACSGSSSVTSRRPNGAPVQRSTRTAGPRPWTAAKSGASPVIRRSP